MNQPTTYTAFTIGPIYKTLTQQRRTRSIFAASYFLSYIMKQMLHELSAHEKDILIPSSKLLNQKTPGTGLFPDRLIMKGGNIELLNDAREKVFKDLIDKIQDLTWLHPDYLKSYLKIYTLELEIPEDERTIHLINEYLDNLELQETFPSGEDSDALQRFFHLQADNFMTQDAFGEDAGKSFKSLFEIATSEVAKSPDERARRDYEELIDEYITAQAIEYKEKKLYRDLENQPLDPDEDFLYENLQTIMEEDFRDYMKYIAIIYADGDRFGSHIKNLNGDASKLQDFSSRLFVFNLQAKELIENYGGAPVYIGGDDLLFFAPVANMLQVDDSRPKTLFHLINQLDEAFHEAMGEKDAHGNLLPLSLSMSYGVSLSYHKYPMNEALKEAAELLFSKAKDNHTHETRKVHPNKNVIAFKVLKHSGQFFEAIIDKDPLDNAPRDPNDPTLYQHFMGLLDLDIKGENFLNSLTHSMAFFQDLFVELLVKSSNPDPQMIQNLFDNNLNEGIHNQNRAYINQVAAFVIKVFTDLRNKNLQNPLIFEPSSGNPEDRWESLSEKGLGTIYATLRFIHFIRSKRNKNVYV